MRLPNDPDRPPQINIVPMIDVIFAILVYFIVSSLFLTRSEGLPVNLPQAETVQLQQSKQITVSLDSTGSLTVDSEATELSQLRTIVENILEERESKVVVVNADKTVDHGQVVDVLDELRQISGVSLAIAAKKE